MTMVKICGITNLEDARHAVACGADMLGFNFYDESPRLITPYEALEMTENIPEDLWKVGVFVNMEPYRIDEFVTLIGLKAVQIHGDEDAAFVAELRTETRAKIIKAFRIGGDATVPETSDYGADFILLDGFSVGQYGGAGRPFDWSVVHKFDGLSAKLILAGGLTPDNVANAVQTVRPYAVDVASGVESSPGKKDPEKVAAFIKAAKEAI